MRPTNEKHADTQKTHDSELLNRLELVAKKSREVYDGAIEDFRNSFTLGPTKFDGEQRDQ
ncbi:Hypothetical protein NGAL_HAMBI2427_40900 [Neorhizobium galegae bv. orientalis]|nr:Hypothetical protein NGAL_HAMBI2427_40900 [Neorhizobium galegae bv. orientalis]CDZ72228.1 Hypothetical protein NGAL_HAMBI2610_38520 [Neorhizobium galegae bv. orientalis]